jgi:hypothetical protein
MQQATVNLFADISVQPATLQAGLAAATASTDGQAPVSTIAAPAAGAALPVGVPVSVSGTASDTGGGVVAAVEVSTDGGATWRAATGTTAWSFPWTPSVQGSVTLRTRAVDDSGNLESPAQSVTVSVGPPVPPTCPCTVFPPSAVPTDPLKNDGQAFSLGMKFRAAVNGFATAVRVYRAAGATGTLSGQVWSSSGTLLGQVIFPAGLPGGWQQAALLTAVPLVAGTTYVVSYHSSSGDYAFSGSFYNSAVDTGVLRGLANGEDGPNGVYLYGPTPAFPTQTFQASHYWADVVFETSVGPELTPPVIVTTSPASGATAVAVNAALTATASEAWDGATVNAATVLVTGPGGVPVGGSVGYAGGIITFTPSSPLAFATAYTATLRGGATEPRIRDVAGNALAADVTWTFTTASPPPPPPTEGPGGPILVISSAANPFSRYPAEILRAEGLNAFTAMDVSLVTPAVLATHGVVILGEFALTPAQVTMLTEWVNGGGNLIALRPDKQLAGLLGLADAGTTLANAYLLIDTAAAPGNGLVNETIQFHGIADRYTLAGASSLASLYTTAANPAGAPAVTLNSAGAGKAAAFTYDLARSVVYTRQGNPAWSAQRRDGQAGPVRSNNLFFGNAAADPQPDWIDFAKVAIPQADEQQRLLANLILHMNRARRPLPRFWYLPRGLKAAVVMTGNDHATNGTTGRFDTYLALNPGCSLAEWECVRGSSYMYPNTPISNAAASAYVAQGFEIAVHVSTNCADWTPDDPLSLQAFYAPQLATFASNFPGVPAPRTNRTHCIAWSDYDSQPPVSLANGIRLDTNYYYWPGSWIQDRPGLFTGSGMPMRFARRDGTLVDVYQATTQLTDESGQTLPAHIGTLLDNATGARGWYGVFTANMHTDAGNSVAEAGSAAIVAAAQARGVPVVSALQMLQWLDGRNASTFGTLAWNGSALSFTLTLGPGVGSTLTPQAQVLLPSQGGPGVLASLTRGGVPVAYTVQTLKGQSYAVFSAASGDYVVTYAADTTPPEISAVTASPSSTRAWCAPSPSTARG